LLLGPISSVDALQSGQSGRAGGAHHHSPIHSPDPASSDLGSGDAQLSDHGKTGPAPSDKPGQEHGLTGCCVSFCALAFAGMSRSIGLDVPTASTCDRFAIDDPLLRSLYLDGDPPVPRS
jgi:hypothetical protein